jgi:V/A-type H+-transporting ATPase subunit I
VTVELDRIGDELFRLAQRWTPLYRSALSWLDDRLSILKTTAFAFETRMCFFIHGWMPSRELTTLREKMNQAFGPKVVLEERALREEDLERVPIVLRNPAYFKPFELLTGLLPLPAYTSYDPTPFLGVFFPIFFGIILGDAGYGLVLAVLALYLRKKFRQNRVVRDGATVLLISSFYVVFFGVIFAEFFGDLPERLFHIQPICIERRTAIVPMMLFALAIGTAHVILGLLLGAVSAFRRKVKREGLSKVLNVVIIVCIIAVVASLFGFFPEVLTRPLVLLILFLTPVLFFAGGVLAPLEREEHRKPSPIPITAIGLTSSPGLCGTRWRPHGRRGHRRGRGGAAASVEHRSGRVFARHPFAPAPLCGVFQQVHRARGEEVRAVEEIESSATENTEVTEVKDHKNVIYERLKRKIFSVLSACT